MTLPRDISHREADRILAEWIPHPRKIQHESLDLPFSRYRGNSIARLRVEAGTVDLNLSSFGIDQPSQLSPVGQPLSHLFPKCANPVQLRTQFDHEVGTDRPVPAENGRIEGLDALLENPGGIRRSPSAVGQHPSGRGVKSDPSLVAFSPVAELTANLIVPSPSQRKSLRHDDQLAVGGQFELEVRMLGAALRKGFVGHKTDRQDCGKVCLVNQERHTSEYTAKLIRRCCASPNNSTASEQSI